MSLIECPECSKEASEHAQMCPHCGYTTTDFSKKEVEVSEITLGVGDWVNVMLKAMLASIPAAAIFGLIAFFVSAFLAGMIRA